MQSWIAQHDQSKLPNVGNNIWKAGDIMYANLDDNPAIEKGTSATDPKDLTIIGNYTPRFRFGFSLGADYKGFDINLMFQGVAKRDVWVGGDDRTAYSKGMIFWGINGGQWDSTGYEDTWITSVLKEMKWEQISMLIIRAPLLEVNKTSRYKVVTCRMQLTSA